MGLVFFIHVVTPPEKFSSGEYLILDHRISSSAIVMGVWLIISLAILVYVFSLIREMFSISPSYVASMFYESRYRLFKDFKKCSVEKCDPFVWLNVLFNLIKVAIIEEKRIPGEVGRVSEEVTRLLDHFESQNPQWWRLHLFKEINTALAAFLKYSTETFIIIPLKQANDIDSTVAYSLGEVFEELSKVLINNYLYLYPSFRYFLDDLRELSKIEPYYVEIELKTISKALERLVEFKEDDVCGNSKNRECVGTLKKIYKDLPNKLGFTHTSVQYIIERAVEFHKKHSIDLLDYSTSNLMEAVFKVLSKYPQLLIPMSNSQIEQIPLTIKQRIDLTKSFIEEVVLLKLKDGETIFIKLPDGRFHFSSETLAMKEILLLLFKQLSNIGYDISIESSILHVSFKGQENTTPYPFELPKGFQIKLENENQKMFMEYVLSELNAGNNEIS
ncbi:MAG: hypothetical protein GXO14_01635 [Thermococci archaeon]|nr:hypothetical protein [Thermococci archaeon]